ncbi:MAG: ATP-binding protein, partial [Candidatus Binatia bacterium]
MGEPLGSTTFGPFVGRERELAEVRLGLEEALRGRGRLFLVSGEPGVGKTRFAEVVAEDAAREGMRVLWVSCCEGGGAPELWPWRELLRTHLGSRSRSPRPSRTARHAVAPEVRMLLGGAARRKAPPRLLELSLQETTRFRFFDAVTTFWRTAAAEQPILLVLDDLHWCDQASLLLLDFLARQIYGARILVVAACRSTEAADPGASRILAEISRRGRHIPLGGLSEPELHQLLLDQFGWRAPDVTVNALYRSTSGNPFFVGEIVRLFVAEKPLGSLADLERTIPESVREAIRRRLAPVSGDGREILSIASVSGERVEVDLLARISGLERSRLLAVLDELAAAALLVRAPDDPGVWRFPHALLRSVLYDSLDGVRRVALHARIGEELEARMDSERHLAEIAEHFRQAAVGGEHGAKAIDYLVRAADVSLRALAYEEAAARYEKALRILEATRRDDARHLECLLSVGLAWGRAGEADRAREA